VTSPSHRPVRLRSPDAHGVPVVTVRSTDLGCTVFIPWDAVRIADQQSMAALMLPLAVLLDERDRELVARQRQQDQGA